MPMKSTFPNKLDARKQALARGGSESYLLDIAESRDHVVITIYFKTADIICLVFEYGHGTQSRICATSSTDHSIRLHDGSKMRTILFKYAQFEPTMRTAIMHETWGPCARASQFGEKSL